MPTYKNIGGDHVFVDGSVVKNGDVCTCDEDLCAKFVNKFERVHADETTTPAPKKKPKVPQKPETETGPVDVTDDFEGAAENDLKVIKENNGWSIIDDGEVVNEKPLRKKEVAGTIEEYLS